MDELLVETYGERITEDLEVERGDFEIDSVRTYVLRPTGVADDSTTPLYFNVHGGGLVTGAGEACLAMTLAGGLEPDMITWATDYRMPPRHPYPAGLDDLVAAYGKALDERDPLDIFVAGGSAGGNLAPAMLLRAKDEGLPMPAALILSTPEVDLTESGDTFRTLLGIDKNLGRLMAANLLYADGHDLSHPYLSPLFGDLSGFPPTYLQSGTRDIFLSNTVLMHRALRAAGVEAELHIGEAMPHGGFGGTTPEDLELAAERARFVARHRRHS
jgi:prepilin-type processing-associated H-X9-DG protein